MPKKKTTAHGVLSWSTVNILLSMLGLLVVAVLALPSWPYATKWGYYPTGACGVILMALVALILTGRL
jgi:bacteriorhodopsin